MSLSRITSASIANSAISAADIADGTITAAKIISVANTQITGNIVSSQIAPSIVLTTPALGTPASGVLTNCTGVAAAALPAGSVLQVVQGTYADQVTNTTATYVDSGLTATITPISASNKILIFAYLGQCGKSANDTQLNLRIVRAATSIFSASALNQGLATSLVGNPTLVYLDSPATTSATAYKVQLSNREASGSVFTNSNGTVTITLMEIAG